MFARMNDIDRMFGTMDLFRTRMERMFNEFDRSYLTGPALGTLSDSPRTNLIEHSDHYEVRAELPGTAKDDLNIKIQGNYLEISGRRAVSTPEGYKIHRNERKGAAFSRSFTLPREVAAEKAEASLKDGILYLNLPKSEAARSRQITIN